MGTDDALHSGNIPFFTAEPTLHAVPGHPAVGVVRRYLPAACSLRALWLCAAVLLAAGCSRGESAEPPARAGDALAQRRALGRQQAAYAEDGQWHVAAKDYQSTRFSGLTQITAANVRTLQPAWTFSTGIRRGHEAAPLVVGSTMYIVTPF